MAFDRTRKNVNSQPVLWGLAARAILMAVTTFGIGLTAPQVAAVAFAVEAVVAAWTWKRVVPEANIEVFESADQVFAALTEGMEIDWDAEAEEEEGSDADDSE